MPATVAFVQRTVACLMVLALGYAVPTLANPQDYPQFAQQQEDPSIPITFIGPHHLASLAYQQLYRAGYRNMQVLEEGLPGWQQHQYPLEGLR